MPIPILFRAPVLVAIVLLGGCASFSSDGGLIAVNDITAPALRENTVAVRTPEQTEAASHRVRTLLRQPLSADRAVQIALLNNRELQASFNALRLSEATMIQASLPPNPTFSLERIAGTGALEIEGRIAGSLLQLATLPVRADIAADRFRQAQFQAAADTLRIANEARRAFYRAVAMRALAAALSQARKVSAGRRRTGEASWRNRRDEQTGSSTQSDILRRDCGATRDRTLACRVRTRAPCAGAWFVGR